jgi:hypothetical protein
VIVYLVAVSLALLIALRGQFEIAWVMASSRRTHATITAISCSQGRYQTGVVTLTFNDASGVRRTVDHTSVTPGCFYGYHVGDVIRIQYSSVYPAALLTQAEVDGLPGDITFYAVVDVIFLSIPIGMRYRQLLPWSRRKQESPGRFAGKRFR